MILGVGLRALVLGWTPVRARTPWAGETRGPTRHPQSKQSRRRPPTSSISVLPGEIGSPARRSAVSAPGGGAQSERQTGLAVSLRGRSRPASDNTIPEAAEMFEDESDVVDVGLAHDSVRLGVGGGLSWPSL